MKHTTWIRIFIMQRNTLSTTYFHFFSLLMMSILCLLNSCTPVKTNIENQYKIIAFSTKSSKHTGSSKSILISQSDAIAGYQTEQMLYTDTLYQLNAFAHTSWISPPATMLTPLIVQSLQNSHYFYAVASGPNADKTDYRLDTQLISLQQNFLTKPSTLEFRAQSILTRVNDNRVLASHIFIEHIPCPTDTPYGGVIAANRASQTFTEKLTKYVIQQVEQDKI